MVNLFINDDEPIVPHRINKNWKKFKENQTSERRKLENKGELTKSLSDNSLSSKFSASKVTKRNESTDIVLK